MTTYRVKFGYTFGGATLLPSGSLVELTEAEAAGFLDKLEPVEGGEGPVQSEGRLVVSVPPKGANGDAASAPPLALPDEEPGDEPGDEQTIFKADVKKAVKSAKASGEGEV